MCTFVYGATNKHAREELLNQIVEMGKRVDDPWIILGDFNCISNLNERIENPPRLNEITPLRNCMESCGLFNLKSNSRFFTWNNKQSGHTLVISKTDRVIGNHLWEEAYPNVEVTYLPEGMFDHTPMLVCFLNSIKAKKPFKFYNHWGKQEDFLEMVNNIWKIEINGYKNFQILKKMQMLKPVLKNKYMSPHLEDNLRHAVQYLNSIQQLMHSDPMNTSFAEQEHEAATILRKVKNDFALYTTQRAKLNWIKYGDENSKLFHNSIKHRRNSNTIRSLLIDGNRTTD